jgi:hypothetical protein
MVCHHQMIKCNNTTWEAWILEWMKVHYLRNNNQSILNLKLQLQKLNNHLLNLLLLKEENSLQQTWMVKNLQNEKFDFNFYNFKTKLLKKRYIKLLRLI